MTGSHGGRVERLDNGMRARYQVVDACGVTNNRQNPIKEAMYNSTKQQNRQNQTNQTLQPKIERK